MTEKVLIDTAERYHAWNTGRGVETQHYRDGGLRIAFDPGEPRPAMLPEGFRPDCYTPSVTLNGPEGEITLTGHQEISAAACALIEGAELARRCCNKITPGGAR